MNFEFTTNSPDRVSADVLLVFVYSLKKGDELSPELTESYKLLDSLTKGQLTKAAKLEQFKGSKGEFVSLLSPDNILPTRIVLVGLGERKKFNLNHLRETVGLSVKKFKTKADSLILSPVDLNDKFSNTEIINSIVEGAMLGNYTFFKYKKDKKKNKLQTIIFAQTSERTDLRKVINNAELYSQATILARDLVNEQSAIANPTYLADLAMDIAKVDKSIKCKIYNAKECEEMGMNAFLGIARASDTPAKFIYLSYTPEKEAKKTVALVGKGITFDSGGINVKPGDSMKEMKMDMAGAAVVLGVFSVISKIKPKNKVIGLIAATPNLISGKSLVPGDVVKSFNGKTIEILNTDAEGRVTMADSLAFAVKEGAEAIIDFATLTGACMVALGTDYAGLFSNDKLLADKIEKAADYEGEKVWSLPLPEEYKKLNESSVADVANIPSSRYGGAITAALFLKEFIAETSWAHLDIAGPAFAYKDNALNTKGGTGMGVRMTLKFLEEGLK